MLFKGPGPFKKFFKIGGNVDELKAYRLIPLTPPLFFHFTLPLMATYFLPLANETPYDRDPPLPLTVVHPFAIITSLFPASLKVKGIQIYEEAESFYYCRHFWLLSQPLSWYRNRSLNTAERG
jgi:hypothetical protein